MKHLLRSVLVILLALLPACVWPQGDSRVFVTSEPPGAEVLVDGQPTGKTTPAVLDLGGITGDAHTILVQKKGYEPEERRVTHFTRFDTAKWNDGVTDFSTWALPLFWTVGDLVFPFEVRWAYVPHDLYVKLFPEGTFQPKPARTLPEAAESK